MTPAAILGAGDLEQGVLEGQTEDLDAEVNGVASQVAFGPTPVSLSQHVLARSFCNEIITDSRHVFVIIGTMSQLVKPANAEHEQLIRRLLRDRKKVEALEWLKGNCPEDERLVGSCATNQDSIKFVGEIYAAGPLEVLAVRIHKILQRGGHRTGKLVVKLPPDAKSRKDIFEWCRRQGDSLGFTPDPDQGESHLFLLLD